MNRSPKATAKESGPVSQQGLVDSATKMTAVLSLKDNEIAGQGPPSCRRLCLKRAAQIRQQKRERAANEIKGEGSWTVSEEERAEEMIKGPGDGSKNSTIDASTCVNPNESRVRSSGSSAGVKALWQPSRTSSIGVLSQTKSAFGGRARSEDSLAKRERKEVRNLHSEYVPPQLPSLVTEPPVETNPVCLSDLVQALDCLSLVESSELEVATGEASTPSPGGCVHMLTSKSLRGCQKTSQPSGVGKTSNEEAEPATAKRLLHSTKPKRLAGGPLSQSFDRLWILFLGVFVAFSLTVAIGFVVTSFDGSSRPESGTPRCDLLEASLLDEGIEPDIFTQCRCYDQLAPISAETLLRYGKLRATIMTESDDIVIGELDEIHTCTGPRTLALLHLATSKNTNELPFNELRNRYLLTFLFLSWNGFDWKINSPGWLSDAPICQWFGVSCGEDGEVISIELDDNRLVGQLEPELGSFVGDDGEASLERLSLRGNSLLGPMPPELMSLKSLRVLCVESELFSEELLESLRYLTIPC